MDNILMTHPIKVIEQMGAEDLAALESAGTIMRSADGAIYIKTRAVSNLLDSVVSQHPLVKMAKLLVEEEVAMTSAAPPNDEAVFLAEALSEQMFASCSIAIRAGIPISACFAKLIESAGTEDCASPDYKQILTDWHTQVVNLQSAEAADNTKH